MLTIRRTWRTAAAAAVATAALAVATPAAHAAATTLVLDAQENYYLPTKGEGPNLDLGITASGGDALDVSVAVDASSLAGKATMVVTGDCVSTGTLKVRCDKGVMLLVQDSVSVWFSVVCFVWLSCRASWWWFRGRGGGS